MKALPSDNLRILREKYIRALSDAKDETGSSAKGEKELADDLFALDLTMYSKSFSFTSLVYNAFATSLIDEDISLHPEQVRIISHIENNAASIISAPTSFGKTFCIFEYIVKHGPHNVVLIVPTLALVDEYLKKIIKRYRQAFGVYKVHIGIGEDRVYDFNEYNIFVLTHDRIVQETAYSKLEKIDFLVIDEVYKLETDPTADRVLVLNMAYYYLAKKAEKYTLLAPFISSVLDSDALEKSPTLFSSQYSPVVNDVTICQIANENDRFAKCQRILSYLGPEDKTLVYFPTVSRMYRYISEVICKEDPLLELQPSIQHFIEWAKEEIHEEWCLITALERGYLIHNGQIPVGTRMFQLDCYEQSEDYNRMLCTSTLLEGVNTTAKNIIITKPSRRSSRPGESFTAFDFFNLVGRTGRLCEHYVGDAYYIKSPKDPPFAKADAIRSIRFEISDDSKDIDIQKRQIEGHRDVRDFLNRLEITIDEYLERIGVRIRFDTVVEIYDRYLKNKADLLKVLQKMKNAKHLSRYGLVLALYSICESQTNRLNVNMITGLLSKRRPKIKSVIDSAREYFPAIDINVLISTAIRMKTGYIEHTFYNRVLVIRFFMEKQSVSNELLGIIDDRITDTIEFLYFTMFKHKKMLLDLGIYERDIDKIIKVIGDDFEDTFELKQRLSDSFPKLKGISYISKYVIQNML